ncbi:MAG: hypothetical protein EOP52_01500 [Sphingobacteriales bacterium]|nr:MAG: hypothetical protein EOP52_01500 [Sphingobacteriales bacterium]
MTQTFEAKLDDLSKILTYVLLAILVVPFILLVNEAAHGHPEVLIPFAVVFIILGITTRFRIRRYQLTPDTLEIVQVKGIKSFPRASFQSATPVTTKDLGFGIRLFGSGGFLGYFGTFFYRNVGKVKVYATDRTKLILLRQTDGKQVMISPADPAAFLQALKLPPAVIVNGAAV